MLDAYDYDVFLSHNSKDKPIVRHLAERLRSDGLRVWFDEWAIQPGDSIPAKVEEGLERSRVLLLCLSANARGSAWATLESQTFRFRDPLNQERRFIPLRLDETEITGSLAQFLYIDWQANHRAETYPVLLASCLPPRPPMPDVPAQAPDDCFQLPTHSEIYAYAFSADGRCVTGSADGVARLWDAQDQQRLRVFEGHGGIIWSVAWDVPAGTIFTGSADKMVRMWDETSGLRHRTFRGHTGTVWCVEPVGRFVLSGSQDRTIRMWNPKDGRCMWILEGHAGSVLSLAANGDDRHAASGSSDNTIRIWDLRTGACRWVGQGHGGSVQTLAWGRDQGRLLSGANDTTMRLWDTRAHRCLRVFEGHTKEVFSVAWSPDQKYAASASRDNTIRIWDVATGRCLRVLTGAADGLRQVQWMQKQRLIFSGDRRGQVLMHDVGEALAGPEGVALSPEKIPQVQYTNAKVLLVGDPGVGKTGLSNFLTHDLKADDQRPTLSTDGAWATQWTLPHTTREDGFAREIWLWDFAGQVDYRLVHQLFMDDTAAAVLVFNPQSENPFEGLGHWDHDLQKAARKPFAKLLAAGRIDRGGLVVSRAQIDRFLAERNFLPPLHETSARTGQGCAELRDAIVAAIDWKSIPETTSPALYHRMKQEILNLRDQGLILIRLSELKQRMELALPGEAFDLAQLEAVVNLLSGPGMIKRVEFGGFILLQPEVLSRYAAAVVRKVRQHPQELGCIREDEMLAGNLDFQDFVRLPKEDETVVLRILQEIFVSRAWCLRQSSGNTAVLTFPSYFRRERSDKLDQPNVVVTYRFAGPAEDIYATLVVLLHHTGPFEADQLWKYAADFKTQTRQGLGFKLTREAEGLARLEIYFSPGVDENSRVVFLRYVHNHLNEHARNVVRLRHYGCGNKKCHAYGHLFTDQATIDKALAPGGRGKVFCPGCGKPISLRDVMEEKFESPALQVQVHKIKEDGQNVLDNESRELLAVHHAGFVVAEAGQIYRGYTNSDHGIDAEIEFKNDRGQATGRRLYLQLKSGDSYLKIRKSDGAEIFRIKEERWAAYWQAQGHPVMLVIRNSEGEIRWMNVSEYLRKKSRNGTRPVKQIEFQGERLDMTSVRRWREQTLRTADQSIPIKI